MPGINFSEVKRMVGMKDLLAHYGLEVRPTAEKPNQFKGYCPLPSHAKNNTKESFSVTFETDEWKCWAPSCAAFHGTVLDFTMAMEGCSLLEAAKKILEWFGEKPQKQESPPSEPEGLPNGDSKPHLVRREEHQKRCPIWKKSPAENISDRAQTGSQPVQQKVSAVAPPVKLKPMQEFDLWFDEVMKRGNESDAEYWQRVRNALKNKFIENYKEGQKAGKGIARTA